MEPGDRDEGKEGERERKGGDPFCQRGEGLRPV